MGRRAATASIDGGVWNRDRRAVRKCDAPRGPMAAQRDLVTRRASLSSCGIVCLVCASRVAWCGSVTAGGSFRLECQFQSRLLRT